MPIYSHDEWRHIQATQDAMQQNARNFWRSRDRFPAMAARQHERNGGWHYGMIPHDKLLTLRAEYQKE